ncbi:MAG: hypothetical protein M1821_002914 [Bathelium mastoideum]|nr:MAG: hypothetical protein M1821_002914 [Bathelium mastoideum]KAI9694443.1 MAG: hypothetical protein M1822_000059 [Bathelium mastoideum]
MFLSLPRELREQVYHQLLCPRRGLLLQYDPESKRARHFKRNIHDQVDPNILRVSRTIYEEALPVLYSSNTLNFQTSPQAILTFLQSSPIASSLLRSLTFHEPIPLPPFVVTFQPWRILSAYIASHLPALRTITIRPPLELGLFEPSTFHPAPTARHAPQDCWWPPARSLVAQLMDAHTSLDELRLWYTAYRHPKTGEEAVFRSEEEMKPEALYAVQMLRVPRGKEDEAEEEERLEGLKRTGMAGVRVRAYNEAVLRRGSERAKWDFTVTRRDEEREDGEGPRSIVLVLRRPLV